MPKRLIDQVQSENPDDAKRIRTLEAKLAQAQGEIKGYKNRYEEVANELAISEKSLQLFRGTRGEFENYTPPKTKHKRGGEASAVIIATDWHSEERVDLKTTNGHNEFNLEIADRRVDQLCEKTIILTNAARSISNIKRCTLGILGDMITGQIHEELAETNFLTPIEAVRWVQQRLRKLIQTLLDRGDFEQIDVYCLSGNHGRDTRKQRVSTRESHSYESFAYHNLAERFESEPRLRFHIAEGILLYANIEGHVVRLTHGDAIKFGGGVGGLGIPANKRIQKWDQITKADYTFFGHWHQFLWQGNWVSCPTLKGYDPFSIWIGAGYEPPAQMFAVIDSERGLTEAKPIYVEPAEKRPRRCYGRV